MGIRLPDIYTRKNPQKLYHLKKNAEVLTTPHDIYATILDVLNLEMYKNDYKVKGADLTRGLSLLEPVFF